jgi:hypothetical protein
MMQECFNLQILTYHWNIEVRDSLLLASTESKISYKLRILGSIKIKKNKNTNH